MFCPHIGTGVLNGLNLTGIPALSVSRTTPTQKNFSSLKAANRREENEKFKTCHAIYVILVQFKTAIDNNKQEIMPRRDFLSERSERGLLSTLISI